MLWIGVHSGRSLNLNEYTRFRLDVLAMRLKILQKLSSFSAFFYKKDRNEIDEHFRGWIVGREVPMSHHSQKGLCKAHTTRELAKFKFRLFAHTHRVNIWRGEEGKSRRKRRLNVLTWVRRWFLKFPQSTVIWICLWKDPSRSAFDHDVKFMIRLSQNYSTL